MKTDRGIDGNGVREVNRMKTDLGPRKDVGAADPSTSRLQSSQYTENGLVELGGAGPSSDEFTPLRYRILFETRAIG